jgi:MFS transporter, FHS family, L-fucose permease
MAATLPSSSTPSANGNGSASRGAFAIMTSLFFLWGFMTVFNDILIPRFKEAFTLDYFRAMLVQFAFFGAYFVGALIYFVVSMLKGDPIARIGYKNGVVLGLLISAAGSALFWPAASWSSYPLFLGALFVVGLGFAMLQIAANPYVTILGPEKTASSRLNLAQAFNSFGTTTGPLIGGYLIFDYFAKTGAHGADSVKLPYLGFCIVFIVLAVVFFSSNCPISARAKSRKAAAPSATRTSNSASWRSLPTSAPKWRWAVRSSASWRCRYRGLHGNRGEQVCGDLLGRPDDRPLHGRRRTQRDRPRPANTCSW